jgi:hypothetical protein
MQTVKDKKRSSSPEAHVGRLQGLGMLDTGELQTWNGQAQQTQHTEDPEVEYAKVLKSQWNDCLWYDVSF